MRIRFALCTFLATIVLAPFESALAEWSIPDELQAAASALNDEQTTFITSGDALKFVPERQLEHELATRNADNLRRFVDDLMSLAAQMGYDRERDMGAAPLNLNATDFNYTGMPTPAPLREFKREPGPFSVHRYMYPKSGVPTFGGAKVAIWPEDLVAGNVDVAIIGVPSNMSSGRRDALHGPFAMRAMNTIATPDIQSLLNPLEALSVVDYGNLAIDNMSVERTVGHVTDMVAETAGTGAIPMIVGGDTSMLYPGVSYRNIMVDSSASADQGEEARDWSGLVTVPPHDILGQPIAKNLPSANKHAAILRQMIDDSQAAFVDHEINQTRNELGELPATHVWPWGQGRTPQMPSFQERFGLRGAMITAVDLLAGLAHYIGWDRLDVPGQTSYHDNDYVAAGQHAIAALQDYDLVCVHIEAPDEASHAADPTTKVQAIEAIDRHVVGPIHDALEQSGDRYRILYLPDHYTTVSTRMHDPTPVPFVVFGSQVHSVLQRPFSERNAGDSDLHIRVGHDLMEYFLFSGQPSPIK